MRGHDMSACFLCICSEEFCCAAAMRILSTVAVTSFYPPQSFSVTDLLPVERHLPRPKHVRFVLLDNLGLRLVAQSLPLCP